MKKTSILVVDDEPFYFDSIEALLDDEGYDLHYAASGQEALDGLVVFDPDLILLDVMMPGLNGIEACRLIKMLPEWQMVPILMVTALSEKQDLARCLSEGADDFISKPVDPLELRARVQSLLRIKRQYDRIKALSQRQAATISMLQSSLNQLRSNVAMSLPHELNTSLNGISGIIDLLLSQRVSMSDSEVHEFLDIAQESAHRLEKLIHRFLVYLQLEVNCNDADGSPQRKIEPVSVKSRSFLEYCAKQQSKISQRLGDLKCNLQEATVLAHPMDLKFVVEELLENAFKFSNPGSPVTIKSEIKANYLVFSVIDHGRGMTVGQIERIGAFMQFDRGYHEQQGIGLGLEIIKKLTTLHHWRLSISSIVGEGTIVGISLPLDA